MHMVGTEVSALGSAARRRPWHRWVTVVRLWPLSFPTLGRGCGGIIGGRTEVGVAVVVGAGAHRGVRQHGSLQDSQRRRRLPQNQKANVA